MPALTMRVPFCGLPCPEVSLEDGCDADWAASGGCPHCRREAVAVMAMSPDDAPRVGGRTATAEEALDAAARLLRRARSPFVYGLSLSPMGAVRAATRIARALRGAIDIEGTAPLQPEQEAAGAYGLPAATFGEIRTRADAALLWRCDPRADHPGILPSAAVILVVPQGDAPRTPGATDERVRSVPIRAGADLEAILALRAFAAGSAVRPDPAGRLPMDALAEAGVLLRRARYAAIVWDDAALRGPDALAVACALMLLARDLNAGGRAAARPLGCGGNAGGAMSALLSMTGYGSAVGFHGGIPRHAAESFSGAAMLQGGGADAVLLVGARGFAPLSTRPPLVVVGGAPAAGCGEPDVVLPSAAPGRDGRGLFLRADGIPVPIRPIVATGRPQEEEILTALLARLEAGPP